MHHGKRIVERSSIIRQIGDGFEFSVLAVMARDGLGSFRNDRLLLEMQSNPICRNGIPFLPLAFLEIVDGRCEPQGFSAIKSRNGDDIRLDAFRFPSLLVRIVVVGDVHRRFLQIRVRFPRNVGPAFSAKPQKCLRFTVGFRLLCGILNDLCVEVKVRLILFCYLLHRRFQFR